MNPMYQAAARAIANAQSVIAVTGAGTTPQIYIEGERIGGADELEAWLQQG